MVKNSMCASVVTSDDDYEVEFSIVGLIDAVGGRPDGPSSDPESPFWSKLLKVMDVQEQRRAGGMAKHVMPVVPKLWEHYTVEEAADAVHNEYPGYHQSLLLYSFLQGQHGDLKVDSNIVPRRSGGLFLEKDVMLADLNTWAIAFVGPHNFGAKYFAGRPRPEEVVWAIKNDEICGGVPDELRRRVKQLDISRPEEFTAYPEGCPPHPSWPAMHSAASQISFVLSVVLDISHEQLCEARKMDYAVAWARTLAGVHYEDDNIAGLNMGQEVLAMKLPYYLSERYGSNYADVKRKVETMRFDWRNFDPSNPC